MQATHIGILPLDVLDTLTSKLNQAQHASTNLAFLKLPHPRTGIPCLFLPSRRPYEEGQVDTILEVQAVTPPNPRSWFIGKDEVIADGKLLLVTPIDPAFLLIPILLAVHPKNGSPGQFRPIDDIFEDAITKLYDASSNKKDLSIPVLERDILFLASLECVKSAMRRICDVKEITDEIVVYRFSPNKLLEYLREKVGRLSKVEVLECSRTVIRGLAKDGLMEDGKENLLQPARIRAACQLLGQYLPQSTLDDLLALYDFTELDAHIKSLQDEAVALAIANLNTGKKKGSEPKDTADEKKRKKSSQGVEKLKKANKTGMSMLSTYFKKTTA